MGGTNKTITITISAAARSDTWRRESRYCLSTEIANDDEEDTYFLERTSRFQHALTFRLWPEIAFVFLVAAFEHAPPSSFETPNLLQDPPCFRRSLLPLPRRLPLISTHLSFCTFRRSLRAPGRSRCFCSSSLPLASQIMPFYFTSL